jgi:periplasmic protein TonB
LQQEQNKYLEKDYTYQSIIASVIIHCALLLLCLLFVLRTPIPPYGPGMGVELNLGVEGEEGFGDIQTHNKANKSPIKEEAAPAKEEKNEDKPVEKPIEREIVKNDPQPVKPEKIVDEKVLTSEDDESKTYVKKTDEKPKKETPVVQPVKKPEVDKRAVFGSSTTSNGTTGTKQQVAGNNNGDRPGKVGDQGDPRGTVDAQALYGNPGKGGPGPGGEGGSRLDLVGWMWDTKPVVTDESDETGKIVFEIKIDSDGNLVTVRTLEKTVSPSVVQYYEREIRKLTFTKTSAGAAAPFSVGKITIIIKSK